MTQPTQTTAQAETKAMTRLVTIIDNLDDAAKPRVVTWLYDRYVMPDTNPDAA